MSESATPDEAAIDDRPHRGGDEARDAADARDPDAARAHAAGDSAHATTPPPSGAGAAALHALAVFAAYALLLTIFFSPVLFTGRLLAPGDATLYFLPNFLSARAAWDASVWLGTPAFADPQAMTWYPPALLCRLLPPTLGWNAFVLLAYALAAGFAHGYVFALTRSRTAAAVAGTTYALCGFMIAHAVHPSLIHAAAWLPLLVWSLEELRRDDAGADGAGSDEAAGTNHDAGGAGKFTRGDADAGTRTPVAARDGLINRARLLFVGGRLWLFAGALSVAMSALAGHPQTFVYTLLLGGACAAFRSAGADCGRARYLARASLVFALGSGLAALQLVPAAELSNLSVRASLGFEQFVAYQLPLRQLPTFFFPLLYGGSPETFYRLPYFGAWASEAPGWNASEVTGYVGLLPPLLAAIAALAPHPRRGLARFWCAVAFAALLLALGEWTPLAQLAYWLPVVNKFRAPARHLFELSFAASVLAGLGAHAVSRRFASPRLVLRVAAAGTLTVLLCLAAVLLCTGRLGEQAASVVGRHVSFSPWANPATLVPLLVLAASCAALILWSRRPASRPRVALLLLVLVCDLASLGWFSQWRFTSPDRAALTPPPHASALRGSLGESRQRALAPRGSPFGTRDELPPNLSKLWGVESAGGYGPLMLARSAALLSMLPHGEVAADWSSDADRALDVAAVRYVLAPRDADAKRRNPTAGADPRRPDTSDLNIAVGEGCGSAGTTVRLTLPAPARATRLRVRSSLACSTHVADGTPVINLTLLNASGRASEYQLAAGRDTSEWAYDCPDVRAVVRHSLARVAASYETTRQPGPCVGHVYETEIQLARPRRGAGASRPPEAADINTVELRWAGGPGSFVLKGLTLVDDAGGGSRALTAAEVAPGEATRWRRAGEAGAALVYENLRARPRAWLASKVIRLDAEAALRAVKTGRLPGGEEFDPASTALVEEAVEFDAGAADASAAARVTRYAAERIEVQTESKAPAFLVLSDASYPGWRASVDGREARVFQTDYALRGVSLPPGRHAVRFEFRPQSLRTGFALSAISLAALLAAALLPTPLWRRRRPRAARRNGGTRNTTRSAADSATQERAAVDDQFRATGDGELSTRGGDESGADRVSPPAGSLVPASESPVVGNGRGARWRQFFARHAAARGAAVVAAYSVFFALFFSPVTAAGKLLAPGDGLNFHVPFFYTGRTLWQPLLWGGYPHAADPQTMTWYPVAALLSLIPGSYNAFVVSAYVIAATTAHGYARALTRSRLAGAVCGLCYSLSGYMLAQQGHLSLVHTAAWAPLVFWSLEELRRAPRARWLAATVFGVAACGLAGHLQVFLYALGLACLYCLFTGWAPARGRARRLALLFSALALGLAATAVQLVPTAELTAHGLRERMTFSEFSSFSLPPRHLLRLFFPYALGGSPGSFYGVPYFGEWGPPLGGWGATELAVYVGLLPLALALVGLLTKEGRDRVAWFWTGAAVLALLLAAGDSTPLAQVVFRLPGYNKFRAPARHLFELALAASVLAAYGAAAVRRGAAGRRAVRIAAAALACAALAALLALLVSAGALRAEAAAKNFAGLSLAPWRNAAIGVPLVVLAAAFAALLLWSRRPGSRPRVALLLLVLVCDLASFGWFYEWRFTSPQGRDLVPPAETAGYVAEARSAGQRVLPARGALTPREGFPPNVSVLWGAPSAGGYSALIPARVSRLLEMSNDGAVSTRWSDADDRALDLFAVRYVFTPRETAGAGDADGDARAASQDGAQAATINREGVEWDADDLGVVLGAGCGVTRARADFELPAAARAGAVAVVSALACSTGVADQTPVLNVTLTDSRGTTLTQFLRAGRDTSEWAYDCPDVRPQVAHARAPLFESRAVERAGGRCEEHNYAAVLKLDTPADIKRVRLEWAGGPAVLFVRKLTLLDEGAHRATPLRAIHAARDETRWRRAPDAGGVSVYENLRARPRAWLAPEVVALDAETILRSIKTGRLPDGREFDPARTALVEEAAPQLSPPRPASPPGARGEAFVTHASDTSFGVRVRADADSFLVLSDVNFPGWRATVDGRGARVFQTDYALRGVSVPAGEHAVEFTYTPRSLLLGATVSACSLAALALAALWLRRHRRDEGWGIESSVH